MFQLCLVLLRNCQPVFKSSGIMKQLTRVLAVPGNSHQNLVLSVLWVAHLCCLLYISLWLLMVSIFLTCSCAICISYLSIKLFAHFFDQPLIFLDKFKNSNCILYYICLSCDFHIHLLSYCVFLCHSLHSVFCGSEAFNFHEIQLDQLFLSHTIPLAL